MTRSEANRFCFSHLGISSRKAYPLPMRAGATVGKPFRRQDGYEEDFAAWADGQAWLLRNRLFQEADLDNIAEELEGLSRSERRALRSCLTLIILHLLKLVHQPAKASRSWVNSIHRERRTLERLLKDSPSLKAHLPTLFSEAYEDGRFGASKETKLDVTLFPVAPAFTLEQVRDPDFMPTVGGDGNPIHLIDDA